MKGLRVIRETKRDQSKKRCLRYQSFVFAALLLGGSIFTGAAAADSKETMIIAGTGASIGAMQLMAKDFQKKHPEVKVAVLPSIGSTGGIKAVREGRIDIGLLARRLKPEEQSGAIIEEIYGRTAFIFGVQDSNPTENLALAEIAEIYAGKRQTWSDGTPIRLILRPLSDAYSVYLSGINSVLKSVSEKAHAIPGVFVGNTDQEAALQIEKTPGSFGTTSGSLIAAEGLRIKALSVDGAAPTCANIAADKYPFVMTLSLVYKKDKYRGVIRDFVEFVFSRDGQKLLSKNGHVTLPRITGK
ncbi:MAG: substrate-binding domain-containing protein [Syntrophales bacterium]